MYTPNLRGKTAILFSSLMLLAFSVYSQVASPPNITVPITTTHTYTISGTVFSEKCPPNPAMGMPCLLSPVPGCTVSVSPVYATPSGAGVYNLPNIWINTAVTDANGKYSIAINVLPNSTVGVSAAKSGMGVAPPVTVSLVNDSTTVNLVLQSVVIPPPPTKDSATLQGTVSTVINPPNPAMGMLSKIEPVPSCTVVVSPMMVPMIYPTPPQFLPRTAVTDANGHYSLSLSAGDYIVSAQKSGLGSAQA
ncbi:MAG: hypothetical protein PHC61_14640, partial [Chitinivibrionales bacterium]|nr:hypothetical protein [Chitinivibrionales bacterium]